MTHPAGRGPDPELPDDPDGPHGAEPPGRLRPTGPEVLVTTGVVGLVGGWSVRALALRLGYAEPRVGLVSITLLFFAAAVIAGSAYATRRTVTRDRAALPPHQAVNRLVLAKASAVVGALLAGGFAGYAVAQLGVGDPAAMTRLWRSAIAALGAVALVAAALRLEHACRVPGADD